MDRKEKKERKEKLSQHMDLSNSRFTDYEIEKLESIVNNQETLNGQIKTKRKSYKAFDSEDRYNVDEKSTYTFCSDGSKIRIIEDYEKKYDDGQTESSHIIHDTAREILKLISDVFIKIDSR